VFNSESRAAAFTAGDVPPEDLHIAGILVHARSDLLEQVRHAIETIRGTEVHGVHPDGKLVVTTEGVSSRALLDAMNAMSAIPGVISATLVYQHTESLQAMQQEMA
jgi:nitrate reductase NapD